MKKATQNFQSKNTTKKEQKMTKTSKKLEKPVAQKSPKVKIVPSGAHFYNGNVKVGDMLTFNKLAGNVVLNNCLGTCGKHCAGCWNFENWRKSSCYVAKSYVQYKDKVINSHIVNTMAVRNKLRETFEDLNGQLKRKRTNKTVRIHSSGELEKVEELISWAWIAEQNPERTFYIYTKAYEILHEFFNKVDNIPKNLFINISIWHEYGVATYNEWKHLDNVRAFVYDDGYNYGDELKFDCHCPAYNKKGKLSHKLTCDKCKICFQNKAKICACYSH